MPTTVPLLIISGSMGAGKTTVLSEASDLLARAGIPHAAIDLDWLSVMHPQQEQALARSTELDGILEGAAIEHFTVDKAPAASSPTWPTKCSPVRAGSSPTRQPQF